MEFIDLYRNNKIAVRATVIRTYTFKNGQWHFLFSDQYAQNDILFKTSKGGKSASREKKLQKLLMYSVYIDLNKI